MLKTVFIDDSQKRVLFFDSSNFQFIWKNAQSNTGDLPSMLDIPFLQQIYEKNGNNVEISTPIDVKIVKYSYNGKFSKRNITTKVAHLFKATKQLGLILNSVSNKEIDMLNKNGGIVISAVIQNTNSVIFVMPYLKTIEKNINNSSIYKSIFYDKNSEQQTEQLFTDEERIDIQKHQSLLDKDKNYFEATIKLPSEIVTSNKADLNRINETSQRTEKLLQEMNIENKKQFNNISSQLSKFLEEKNYVRDQEEKIRYLELELMKCHKTIDNLHNDKNILMNENQKAEQIALNRLKSKLDLSRVAIQRLADINNIDDFNINQPSILELISLALLKANIGKKEIESILGDEEIIGAATAIFDNFATKVQSLIDIKTNFEELEIIEKRKDV